MTEKIMKAILEMKKMESEEMTWQHMTEVEAVLVSAEAMEADILKDKLDQVRNVLYRLLNPVIDELCSYRNHEEGNEEEIERLYKKKDMIEQSIGTLNGVIVHQSKIIKRIAREMNGGSNG
jgi:hypothetical protein